MAATGSSAMINLGRVMRALAMDFAADKKVWNIADEYMFGPALLVAPVVEGMYTRIVSGEGTRNVVREEDFRVDGSRELYLPKGADWYDFWDNRKFTGGQTIARSTPIDIMPLYVRAGAIVPFGPQVQYAEEKPWNDLEIRVYSGANGEFVLYEDRFDSYDYEKGKYSEITFRWDDRARKLTISDRAGSYPGMIGQRTFRVVLVGAKGAVEPKQVSYNGTELVVEL